MLTNKQNLDLDTGVNSKNYTWWRTSAWLCQLLLSGQLIAVTDLTLLLLGGGVVFFFV